eukprot:CAMPEP_0195507062 /NCGR_PEP_ID=MMETSP0794_2-20130614/584_1 /TAXON_ID=515487 /ORGANISM="Stephanopyxis turris, Strain CCMP 815" /LENGTH=71 /DNA_ID=CAMNT_0040633609 /DNA_START=176 /DNA_END=391 /DNA_ORIENTATION=-
MKLSVAALLFLPAVAAFAPSVSRPAFTKTALPMSKPAASKEEDLELTRKVIMEHVSSLDGDAADDDDEDEE